MDALHPDLRRKLERAVLSARSVAEAGAQAALNRLAVSAPEPFAEMSADERLLRNRLRARGRQLGDTLDARKAQTTRYLCEELAYEYWHRMLFARFLAENNLLIDPGAGVPVTLEDCHELAADEGAEDGWVLAARYASRALPQIFRPDDPLLQVAFAPEHLRELEKILDGLPPEVLQADDSLGWIYQFWQTDEKDRVNRAGNKIGADELPAVTQLFTEHYMVLFLLRNTVGAWWVARHGAESLPVELEYLRLLEDGTPAAGKFEGWPETVAELRVLDPCCGSGHFLVAVFNLLVRLRVREEGLTPEAATDAVLRENLFGLELDPRCTQIAAFALALAAWKFTGGYRVLPELNIASSGVAPRGKRAEWAALAGEDTRLRAGMENLYDLFKLAPELGSLTQPGTDLLTIGYAELQPLLDRALQTEAAREDVERTEAGVAARGLAHAAEILAGTYHLVITNVPYLTRSKQGQTLKDFSERRYPEAKADLATVFVQRCLELCECGGTAALVTPQNWLYLGTYKKLRKRLLQEQTWNAVARLGSGAFETISGEVVNVTLLEITKGQPKEGHNLLGINAQSALSPAGKAETLKTSAVNMVSQKGQLNNPDATITGEREETGALLGEYVESYHGITTTDYPRFGRLFWENKEWDSRWVYQQGTVGVTQPYGGKESVLLWEEGKGGIRQLLNSGAPVVITGLEAWGKRGVVINQMSLQASIYTGEAFDTNVAILIPRSPELLPAVWAFCSSPDFHATVRKLNPKVVVEYVYYPKLPFDLAHWQRVADETGPLPEPHSDDPTQWLFKGNVVGSTEPLQVAVARLLGYRWPGQPADELDAPADADGILCLPPVRGERPAAERLRELLARAYGNRFSPALLDELLAAADSSGRSLDEWLRQKFFEQHCRIFHQRPFVWHVWDGRRDGFSALVNYHRLDRRNLEKLAYTYLGDWIKRQEHSLAQGEGGADARLLAARDLQENLKRILTGEKPYDIFVRWKPIEQQPVGWEPDLNDGVRVNIRPFVLAEVLRKRPNINWNKDRGKNPPGSPWGADRLNDRHLSLAEKQEARREAGATV